MSGVGSTYNLTSTFTYSVYFVYNEDEVDEAELDLSEMLVNEPPQIYESFQNQYQKPPNSSTGFYGGQLEDMKVVSLTLYMQSFDPRDIELQRREIYNFFAAAPSRATTLKWVNDTSNSNYGQIYNCRLKAMSPNRFVDVFGIGERLPAIDLILESTETALNYTESGDPSPTAPTLYGPARHRAQTNDGSVIWTIVNDVSGDTLASMTDQGKLMIRGSLIQEDTSL